MKAKTILTAGLLSLSPAWAQAQTAVDQAIEYRQGVYRAMEWNLTRMAAMAQGRTDFDAAEFAERSDRLRLLGEIVGEGFADAKSSRGEGVETRASYRIWDARDRFDEMMAEMHTRTRELQQAAVAGQDKDELRPLVGRVAQSCKACHDKFRD